jgi:hypothetical protein
MESVANVVSELTQTQEGRRVLFANTGMKKDAIATCILSLRTDARMHAHYLAGSR